MSCVNPSLVYVFYDKYHDKRFVKFYESVDSDISLKLAKNIPLSLSKYDKKSGDILHGDLEKVTFVGCGNCIGCALDHSKVWQNRLLLEDEYSINSYFVTLTYDENHIPSNYQLVREHLDRFIKELRNYFYNNFGYSGIRYYCCGEYGSHTGRPHYHLVLFNLPLFNEDWLFLLKKDNPFEIHQVSKSINGEPIFDSDLIAKFWSYGFNTISYTNSNVFGYIARYVNKKKVLTKDEKRDLKRLNIQTEFNRMSLKPGIGGLFYELNKDKIISNNGVIFLNGKEIQADRYFYKILDRSGEEEAHEFISNFRINLAGVNKSVIQAKCTYSEYLKKLEMKYNKINGVLKRSI